MARSRAARRVVLAGLLVVVGFITSGCSLADLPRYGWPLSASEQGEKMQHLWSGLFTAALVVGVIVWGLMFWCFIVYRKRKHSPLYPKQTRENLPVEMVYTAVPFVLVTAIFYAGFAVEQDVVKLDPHPDVTVNVTAFKWNWDFAYAADADNNVHGVKVPDSAELPQTLLKDKDGNAIHTIGTSNEVPVLILPEKNADGDPATIEYILHSRDVVHAFWVPAFDFKRDVFPDPAKNNTVNRFDTTLKREGSWVGRCAELCGTYHSAMNFEVRSVPPVVFDAYIAARKEGLSTPDALSKVGKEHPDACGKNLCSPTATTTYPMETNRTAKAPPTPPPNVTGLN